MNQRFVKIFLLIILIAVVVWIDLPSNPGIEIGEFSRSLDTALGLDLRGGMQVLLEADLPEGTEVTATEMETAKTILENRTNGLGVSEVVFQVAGENRIVGEFPGLTNTDEVIATLKETGQLEFVDFGTNRFIEGTEVVTDYLSNDLTTEIVTNEDGSVNLESSVWHTVLTGDQLDAVSVDASTGIFQIQFSLKDEGADIFADHTTVSKGKYLGIVLDKKVISCPIIENPITGGSGVISGDFDFDSSNNLAIQLRYGSLPIPLKVVESRIVGPTLGQDSLQKSILAGIVGLIIVTLFMTLYYRLPGVMAMISIASYAAITLALFKLIPVTLTLPGIAGLLLSTGGGLDANILMFERLKEELRSGRKLRDAVHLSWTRAWPSIRDSNFATLITSGILFWFGSAYGASLVKGFALTLAIGVFVSLFCASVITRALLDLIPNFFKNVDQKKWFGA
ncbi:MAG: protein translocase subunit SecD [Anaerolineaceae bacterium]|nr:protein translocase subunit SecD [Anaerolineaceae bacterium]